MQKQNKGKDLHKVPKSRIPQGPFYVSKKYDGHYTQIIKTHSHVQFFTSGGKEFYLSEVADWLLVHIAEDFHIECEYNYNCTGLLGDRGKSAIITTYRTNFSKGIHTPGSYKDIFRPFDRLDRPDMKAKYRLADIAAMLINCPYMEIPVQISTQTLVGAQMLAEQFVKEGYEGAMVKAHSHIYQPGKRTNDIIKIKPRLTTDLLCVDVKEGTGKYEGMIGALLLKDKSGREVWAGSGLNDHQRMESSNYYVGKIIEIEYERIDDTYIQPIIKHIRYDKTSEEID